MTVSLILLGMAILILIAIACATVAEAMIPRPYYLYDAESISRAMEADRRAFQAKIFWGIVAVILCIVATVLAM